MAIAVRGKNIDITPPLRDYVEKHVGRVTKYFEAPGDISVVLTVEKGRHIAEVTVPVNGVLLRGEEATQDMYTSVDLVTEKLEKQIEKYKTKIARRMKTGAFKGELVPSTAKLETEDFPIVKTKRFAIKPMDPEEAITQMNLVNHDFFMFTNTETDQVNVVYRRKDGRYGLIEPEF